MNYARGFTALTTLYLICNAFWKCILAVISTSLLLTALCDLTDQALGRVVIISGRERVVIVCFSCFNIWEHAAEGTWQRKCAEITSHCSRYFTKHDFFNCYSLWCCVFSSSQPGSSLEQTHIFVLAHILRRPIIVYGVKYYKSFRGETLGYTRFQGERPVWTDVVLVKHRAMSMQPCSGGCRTRLPLWNSSSLHVSA